MRLFEKLFAISLVGLTACAPYVLAPGAADVRLTRLPADVATCAAVGNVQLPRDADGFELRNAAGRLQNQAIGLGANVVLITETAHRKPTTGVAYRCGSRSAS